MSDIQCFLLEPTGRENHYLRRYAHEDGGCTGAANYHNAKVFTRLLAEGEVPRTTESDPRWPVTCQHCDYVFTQADRRQEVRSPVYRRGDTGEEMELSAAPAGALWFDAWMAQWPDRCGPDGRCLMVRTPGGDWAVDNRARNCDSPCKHCGVPYHSHERSTCPNPAPEGQPGLAGSYEDARPHKCWVRHGDAPAITVDKQGVTCGAGAGSIMAGNYHGFLRDGRLTNA